MLKSILDMYGKFIICQSWVNNKVYNDKLANLESISFRKFVLKFTISIKGDQRNKLCCNQKNNFVTVFYLKTYSSRGSENYYEYCKCNLIKFKPLIGSKCNTHRSKENLNQNIISLWKEYVNNLILLGYTTPNYL